MDTQNITDSAFSTVPRNYFAVLGLEDSQKRFLPSDAFMVYPDSFIKSIAESAIKSSVISGDLLPAYESGNSLMHRYYSSPQYLTSESIRRYKDGIVLEANLLFDGVTYFDRATGEYATLNKSCIS